MAITEDNVDMAEISHFTCEEGDRQVLVAVAVKVAYSDGLTVRMVLNLQGSSGKAILSLAQINEDNALLRAVSDQIEIAIIVQVGCIETGRFAVRIALHSEGKPTLAVTQVDLDVVTQS